MTIDNNIPEGDKNMHGKATAPWPERFAPQQGKGRLNVTITNYEALQRIFARYGYKMTDAARMALNLFAAALPVLQNGGEIVLREADGKERVYSWPVIVN